jgi:TolA-binding protein
MPAPSVASGAGPAKKGESARTFLADGSLVDVDRGGQIQVLSDRPEETRVQVLAGRAEFDVQKRAGRPFITTVRGVEVRVVGTHFSTELDESHPPGIVRVVVMRGVVEVSPHPGDPVARLKAGDKLEVSLGPPATSSDKADVTPAPADGASGVEPSVAAARSASPPPDASRLFEMARDARRANDVPAAIKAYATLLKQFPHDERVGVAALELGRLRMDSQHAYGSAAEAFRQAFAAAPSEGIREDALARLVEALDAMHSQKACAAEQQRYQARYPNGVHASSVRARCTARN